jgi:hypothetical protein
MSAYNTLNPVPSLDPRDLDDNATILDRLLNEAVPSVNDRMGVPRKTWAQVEIDASVLISPNLTALAGLTGAVDTAPLFTGPGAMTTMTVTAAGRALIDDADAAAQRTTLGAAPVDSPTFTGTPAAPTAAVGDSDTSLATTAFVQAEIANKRAWLSFTPSVTVSSGAYTLASATGRYMVAFGICHFQMTLTVTTKGTGAYPILTLPFPALAGSLNMPFIAAEIPISGNSGRAAIRSDLASVLLGSYSTPDLVTADGAVVTICGSYPIA